MRLKTQIPDFIEELKHNYKGRGLDIGINKVSGKYYIVSSTFVNSLNSFKLSLSIKYGP